MSTERELTRAVARYWMGWKEGQRYCIYHNPCDLKGRAYDHPGYREIPPPDLLADAGAWALVKALRDKDYAVDITPTDINIYRFDHFVFRPVPVTDNNLNLALMRAAYQAIPEGERHG